MSTPNQTAATSEATGSASGKVAAPAIEGFRQAATGVFAGGEPKTREAFDELQRAGVKTIVSVDGARPNLELAHEFHMRYVHIPIGYDGVPPAAQAALAEVMQTADRPVFIHCHHGKHRGPAATAIACRAAGLLDLDQAKRLMKDAGTSPDYTGLWRDVEGFQSPPADAAPPKLVEAADVPIVASEMARIDRAFDRLKAAQKAKWMLGDPAKLNPTADALLVEEGFVECLRAAGTDPLDDLVRRLEEAQQLSTAMRDAWGAGDHEKLDATIKQLDVSCKACHKVHRD